MRNRIGMLGFRVVCWLLAAAWLGFILSMSLQDGEQSLKTSGTVTQVIVDVITDNPTPQLYSDVHAAVRETAHFAEFLLLGALLYAALIVCGARRALLLACLLGAALALGDETVQLASPGRAFQLFPDFCLDTAGAALGALACSLIARAARRVRLKKGDPQTRVAGDADTASID